MSSSPAPAYASCPSSPPSTGLLSKAGRLSLPLPAAASAAAQCACPRLTRRVLLGFVVLAWCAWALWGARDRCCDPPTQLESEPETSPSPSATVPPPPDLAARLEAHLALPALTHAEAYPANAAACPEAVHDALVNQDQLRGNRAGWEALGAEEVRAAREGVVRHLWELGERAVWREGEEGMGEGRGVVMTAGNGDTPRRALTLLRLLHQQPTFSLPVEIFHFPGELSSPSDRAALESLGATLREVQGLEKDKGAWKDFRLKAQAISRSGFREVLYLDSDNIPLRDPSFLFDDPAYSSSDSPRAVFWPDFNKDHPSNAIWRILGMTCRPGEWEFESGQILLDKSGNSGLNLAALHIADYMARENTLWYALSGGDKDTFRYAFHLLRLPFTPAPHWLSALGAAPLPGSGQFCGHTMLQYDLKPGEAARPLFAHANLLKHGRAPTPVFSHVKRPIPSSSSNTSAPTSSDTDTALQGVPMRVTTVPGRGMCVDLLGGERWPEVEVRELGEVMNAGREGAEGLEREKWNAREWEESWRKAGGRVGGW